MATKSYHHVTSDISVCMNTLMRGATIILTQNMKIQRSKSV